MLSESDLRRWLKDAWNGSHMDWIEPAIGGTVGYPDVILALESKLIPGSIPVELKVAELKPGWMFRVRPSQIRWHEMNHRAGKRSAFLIGLTEPFVLALLPGFCWPGKPNCDWRKRLSWVYDKPSIVQTLGSKVFWRPL